MAVAATADTAVRWARERGLDLWIVAVEGDDVSAVAAGLRPALEDGVEIAWLTPSERGGLPSPYPVFDVLRRTGIADVRRAGVVSSVPEALVAGRRAGLGAVVAIGRSRELLLAEPDAALAPDALAAYDATRFASTREHRPRVLLNPGPALTSERVKRAAGGIDLCHREREYAEVRAHVVARLREAFVLDEGWECLLLAGSGTAAVEAMVSASVRPEAGLLVCRNGAYGDRIAAMARRLGIPSTPLECPWTEAVDPDAVEAVLRADPSLDAVAVVHHETTTGLLNPVDEIARRASELGRLTVVDAVSSLGGEEFDLAGGGIGMVACSANKCLHGLPGVAFVLLSPAGVARARAASPRSVYLDLARYLDPTGGGVPFTPSIPATYALGAALDELLEEGLVERRRRYRERVALIDRRAGELGLEQLLPEALRSSTIRSLSLPEGISFPDLHDPLRDDGYVIYAGQGELASKIFRIAVLGNVELPALDGLLDRVDLVLRRPRAIDV